MSPKAPAERMAAGAAILLLVLLLPSAQAQDPSGTGSGYTVLCQDQMLEPDYAGQDTVTCRVEDMSRDAISVPGSGSGTGAQPHIMKLSAVLAENTSAGYQVLLSDSQLSLYGGEVREFTVNVKATPVITGQDFAFFVVVNYTAPSGYQNTSRIPFSAQVNHYDFATARLAKPVFDDVGQDDIVIFTVEVTNVGVYPDSYRFLVKGDPDLAITTPPNLFVPPGQMRTANITILTPHDKVFEFGRSSPISVKVMSVTGTGVYPLSGSMMIRGAYIPIYWLPVALIGIVSAGVLTRSATDKLDRMRHERGRPREVELTPKQAILLAELKRTDREKHKEKKAALDAVYKERLAEYRAHKKERDAKDREEARQAKRELKAEKARRKEERKLAAIARKAKKKEERLRQAQERKQAKIEAKEARKKGKVLAKKRKELEKAQAKLAKQEAKEAAAQAKLDAKAAKEAAKAEKAARKAEKAAAREAKKGK